MPQFGSRETNPSSVLSARRRKPSADDVLNERKDDEYRALRATIRERGSVRVCVFVAGMGFWAALLVAVLATSLPPAAALIPLLVLAATFESVLALHVAVERIGRYLLVFHDDDWERAAGAFGRPRGAIGVDQLFTPIFLVAALLTLLPLATTTPISQELAIIGAAAAAFALRVLLARAACARQRTVDGERFTYLRASDRDTTTTSR